MTTDSIQVTAEEIAQFRTELADNPRAIAALDAIEDCEGYLEDAVPLLLIEAGTEPDRSIGDLFEKCRQFICQEEVREALESGMIAPAIEPISMGAGIPPGVATAIGICAFKLGMKRVCADCAD
ncbi:MAG: hypothetical protein EWV49_13075 [Microcystis aeruginosa Ma_QC_Ch_20071001_S25]|jgi:hypothetical protein|uniref:Uncharacterized protein n=1 Tax=Microcystis aeruginosa Ma_QC_Ch_20071001_S25D TaxID=2486250 RepID=A0A552G7I3_MICAE|nr:MULTISPECIES: hypothetical protein [unclassified Microcystis]MCU7243493.1 hypothetical protein [Microcystis aeruginosa WS75]NCQ86010.1 hypothetical protein [Microcystis aeruginosa W13-18]NCR00238.1 hypothetical protein [Microcystis aeruginosa L211-11]NCR26509.1 hypothetical protein [Microcystis aeruginosa LE13-04]NCR31781.1 hypothetical protein [Microcystis aeruginosa L211-101]NCR43294.1 hypothetical protein [Microcystis aeruginosa SX13-01]NCS10978.1 hypothetical protein [Microcystis aeru